MDRGNSEGERKEKGAEEFHTRGEGNKREKKMKKEEEAEAV